MNKRIVLGGAIAILLVGSLAVAGAWNWLLGPTLEASGATTAIPLESTSTEAAATAQPSAVAAEPEVVDEAASGLTVWQISQAASEVRFVLSEDLRGQPKTVIGASDQVAGEIAVDPDDLSTAEVGVIQVNARTLTTDDEKRNRAIRNFILNTDTYEYITFTPGEVIGLQGSVEPGQTFTFQIAGDLTIRDVTQPVVFDVTATVDDQNQMSGTAQASIQRSDFGLTIPDVPFVANVSEAVSLEIDFVAGVS
jgi:polyisoprenoid-binding protein YceI